MSEAIAPADMATVEGASGGVGLLYNATASAVASIIVSGATVSATPAGFTLFPASQPSGTSVMGGCSFPIPSDGNFSVAVKFVTGETVEASFSTCSQAAPALYIVAFLNGLVVAAPSGRATTIAFTRGLDAISVEI